MTDVQLLLAGPAFATLALILFAIPRLRPRIYTRSTGWLCVFMGFPMFVSLACQSYDLVTLAFFLKPITALLAIPLCFGVLVMCCSKRLSIFTAIPSLLLVVGSVADIYVVQLMAYGWGGASC